MLDRAITPSQKRAIIERLYAAWLAVPEMRLGQLAANAVLTGPPCNATARLFYAEDEAFAKEVELFSAIRGRNPE